MKEIRTIDININLMIAEKNVKNNLPVMMYIHGFRSGANGSKREQLQKHFEGRFRVIAPEVDANPEESLALLNEIIANERPEIIVGTSLGGWMTIMCESGEAELFVVNPCIDPKQTLSQWKDEELPYFCPRLDGVQTYTITQQILDKYDNYNLIDTVKEKSTRIHVLCSEADELLGCSHIDFLRPLLPDDRLTIVNDFGHRCSGAGMDHLFNNLDKYVGQQVTGVIRTKQQFNEWMREIGLSM